MPACVQVRLNGSDLRDDVMVEPANRAHIIIRAVAAPVAPPHRRAT
jgi:hypothetical protein